LAGRRRPVQAAAGRRGPRGAGARARALRAAPAPTPGPAASPSRRPRGGSRSQRPPHAPRAQPPSQPQQEGPGPGATYPYNAGPGERRQKATIEHVFAPGEGGGGASTSGSGSDGGSTGSSGGADTRRPQAPWSVGWQMSERNLVWNDELRMRLIRVGPGVWGLGFGLRGRPQRAAMAAAPRLLAAPRQLRPRALPASQDAPALSSPPQPCQRVASDQLGISEAELDARLQEVAVLLPDLTSRLAGAPVDMVVRLAASTHAIAARLLQIKAAFPRVRGGAGSACGRSAVAGRQQVAGGGRGLPKPAE
jgi:hypothetical protein